MRSTSVIGLLLIVLGLAALIVPRITYTKREKVLDVGPIEATATTKKSVPLSPLVGGLAVVSGIALVFAGSRRQA